MRRLVAWWRRYRCLSVVRAMRGGVLWPGDEERCNDA
jgi:hypothetical protein